MGDHWQSSLHSSHALEAEDRLDSGPNAASLVLQSTVRKSRGPQDPRHQDLDVRELGFEDQEEEVPPEEVAGEEFSGSQNPQEALSKMGKVLDKDTEEAVPEMSHLSMAQRLLSLFRARVRKRRRLSDLAKPKSDWQVLKDRTGCCCKGCAWIALHLSRLQLCTTCPLLAAHPAPTLSAPSVSLSFLPVTCLVHAVFMGCPGLCFRAGHRKPRPGSPRPECPWVYFRPSRYWTERLREDTTLTVTVPVVSRRVEELSSPKRFNSEHHNNRTSPAWPITRPTLEYQASRRLRELATPRVRKNIWSINMSEVSQVSRAAQTATPSPRILWLAKPRAPATLLEEWDPMPKPKPHVSDYSRLLHLASKQIPWGLAPVIVLPLDGSQLGAGGYAGSFGF
ncbi:hypothetical protein MC885_011687 [Smutsia gigantea]|nr:hypothetical protein MC885_011687 [Smutsia gigantea]